LNEEIVVNNTIGGRLHELFGLCTIAVILDDLLIEQYNDTNNPSVKEDRIDAV
jgi:hypothetical protein